MKKIIITGATSMIGTALTEIAVREGSEVYAIVRPNTKRIDRLISSQFVHPVFGTLEEMNEINGLPSDCDVFYHLAWGHTVREERDDPLLQEDNIQSTLDAVCLAKKTGCKRFIGAGSQAEYGIVTGQITTDTPAKPMSAYGMAKLSANLLSGKLCEQLGLEHIWARIFSVYGPHDNEGTMLNNAIDSFLKGKIVNFSAATQIWNYLYESDAGEMFFRLGMDHIKPGIYHIAHPESRVLKAYIMRMIKCFGSDVKYSFAESSDEPVVSLNVDIKKTINAINFIPKINFEAGISYVINEKRNTAK